MNRALWILLFVLLFIVLYPICAVLDVMAAAGECAEKATRALENGWVGKTATLVTARAIERRAHSADGNGR